MVKPHRHIPSITQSPSPSRERSSRCLVILALLALSLSALSPASAQAQTPLISNEQATNDATTVSYQFSYSGSYSWYRVYIDADRRSTTGFATEGIGADYLLENGSLFAHSGIGSGWDWRWKQAVAYSNAASMASWTVARADLGDTNAADLIFQVESPLISSGRYAHIYSTPAIYGQRAGNTDSTVSYQFSSSGSYSWYRVYIDADRRSTTGFATEGIGADYLLENGSLFAHSGIGSGWDWQWKQAVAYSNAASVASWTVARADLGETDACAETADLVFQAEGGSFATAPVLSQHYLTSSTCNQQKMAVPAYFLPGTFWPQLESASPTAGLAVINPMNGPGASRSPDYAAQITRTRAKGILVLGYVSTSWTGALDTSRTLDAVKSDIDAYYRWYPEIDGIFLDEVPTDCASRDAYYQPLYDYIKAKGGRAMVVINPGMYRTQECYMTAADVILNFEGSYSAYQTWQLEATAWERRYPANRFWHLLFETAASEMPAAIAASKEKHAGWVYVTPDVLDNPWDTLPTGAYWSEQLRLIAGS